MITRTSTASQATSVHTLDTGCPALLVKASRSIFHHGSVAIARSLGRLGVPVYAIVYDPLSPVVFSRYVARAFVWKKWPDTVEESLRVLAEVGETIGRRTVLFPVDDFSAAFVAENANELRRWFVAPHPIMTLPRQMGNKASFYALCERIGIGCPPRSIVPRHEQDVEVFVERVGLPVVMKAAEQWALLDGRYSTVVIRDRRKLLALYERAIREGPVQMVLQEFVPGEAWVYHGYSNAETNLHVSFTGRKTHSYPPSGGSTVRGVSEHNEALRLQSEKLLTALGYSGIVDMDWRHDARDDRYKIVDCNPRVGQNFRMFVNQAEIDVVRAQHLDLTGRYIENAPMIEGRLFTVEPFYALSRLGALRERPAAISPRTRELAWLALDDPWPAVMMVARLIHQISSRILRVILKPMRLLPGDRLDAASRVNQR